MISDLIETLNYVTCMECYCRTQVFGLKPRAIKAWNTRKPAEEVVARLEEKMRECRKMKEVVYDLGMHQGLRDAIEIVKEGMG